MTPTRCVQRSPMAARSSRDSIMTAAIRLFALVVAVAAVTGCGRVFVATPEERVGYLRELVRARTVSRDTIPIDACSVNRFMEGVPAWRDSLVQAERALIVEVGPCPADVQPVAGRFVITSWYRNWSGEYVIRGVAAPWDQGYRFTDGVFVGREQEADREYFAGIRDPRPPSGTDSLVDGMLRGDSMRRAGTLAESSADSPGKSADTLR